MQNDPNEHEAMLRTVAYQSAWIRANIALELTLLQVARMNGEGREAAKEKAERTVKSVRRLLPLIEDLLETADRELIQTRLAELESALLTFDHPPAPEP
jgi:hypothetical protein